MVAALCDNMRSQEMLDVGRMNKEEIETLNVEDGNAVSHILSLMNPCKTSSVRIVKLALTPVTRQVFEDNMVPVNDGGQQGDHYVEISEELQENYPVHQYIRAKL